MQVRGAARSVDGVYYRAMEVAMWSLSEEAGTAEAEAPGTGPAIDEAIKVAKWPLSTTREDGRQVGALGRYSGLLLVLREMGRGQNFRSLSMRRSVSPGDSPGSMS